MSKTSLLDEMDDMIGNMLKEAASPTSKMTQDDKLAVFDRALKLEALKTKKEEGMGGGFDWGQDSNDT